MTPLSPWVCPSVFLSIHPSVGQMVGWSVGQLLPSVGFPPAIPAICEIPARHPCHLWDSRPPSLPSVGFPPAIPAICGIPAHRPCHPCDSRPPSLPSVGFPPTIPAICGIPARRPCHLWDSHPPSLPSVRFLPSSIIFLRSSTLRCLIGSRLGRLPLVGAMVTMNYKS